MNSRARYAAIVATLALLLAIPFFIPSETIIEDANLSQIFRAYDFLRDSVNKQDPSLKAIYLKEASGSLHVMCTFALSPSQAQMKLDEATSNPKFVPVPELGEGAIVCETENVTVLFRVVNLFVNIHQHVDREAPSKSAGDQARDAKAAAVLLHAALQPGSPDVTYRRLSLGAHILRAFRQRLRTMLRNMEKKWSGPWKEFKEECGYYLIGLERVLAGDERKSHP